MSRVITFSTIYPIGHPKVGRPTFFVEKILRGIHEDYDLFTRFVLFEQQRAINVHEMLGLESIGKFKPKNHTIRTGDRWKVGDKFSPRIWTGRPYNSRQFQFAPDIEVRKEWKIGKMGQVFFMNDKSIETKTLEEICLNDGLSWEDFHDWFKKAGQKEIWHGQIICWNENINY